MEVALARETVVRSLKVSLIVGSALNLINQGDALMNSESVNIFKCLLTYAVPYCVATYGAVAALRARQDRFD
ncbi:nitrate/nitrite transporter NrtS [Ruegeria sp. R13_0]|uniref:nitrate/nitrite transporter NrtS n=1 Tax=Ruegeria sp. R13_0 TaxID=2821099 RepID=UPI001ADC22DA|nr:nitrate/nitrite transporter NrtS [Ruegeria sp. R13_0]MBO9436424.1 nitrate/nitrite transporter NrtS [Ruegeria sp. R13_0]